MRLSLRGLVSFGLSVLLVAPMLIDAGCASHQANALNDAVTTLSSSGVGVYESTASSAPMQAVGGAQSAMRLTRWQLATMVAQNDAGMGWLGADMDRMEGKSAPKGAPTISMFVAGWLTRGGTPLSTYAKQLMGDRPFDIKKAPNEVFPLLVITLFVADIAPLKAGTKVGVAPSSGFETWIAAPALADGICSDISNFAAATLATVTQAIEGAAGHILASIFTYIIKAIKAAIEFLLAPFLLIISRVSAAIAVIAAVVSLLSKWTVTIDADPKKVWYSQQSVDGTLVATVSSQMLQPPADVVDCAKQLGDIDLADISSNDAPVTWKEYGEGWKHLASVTKLQGLLGSDRKATYYYRTQEDHLQQPRPECAKPVYIGYLGVTASIERIDAVHAQQKLLEVIVGNKMFPTWVKSQLLPLLQPYITSAFTSVGNFLKAPAVGSGYAYVWQMQADPDKCTAPPSPSPSPEPSSDNAALVGAWSCDTTVTVKNKELGPFSVSVQTAMTFDANGSSTGTQWGGASLYGHHVINGPGQGAASNVPNPLTGVKQGVLAGGARTSKPGAYTYDPSDANSGTLHVDGKDLALKFSNPNAFTTQVTSPVSHRTYDLSCKRS